jgi:hypothetical protein
MHIMCMSLHTINRSCTQNKTLEKEKKDHSALAAERTRLDGQALDGSVVWRRGDVDGRSSGVDGFENVCMRCSLRVY